MGLAAFAEKHRGIYGRVQLIRKQRGPDQREHFYRLDFADVTVRNQLRGITSDKELDEAFGRFGKVGVAP